MHPDKYDLFLRIIPNLVINIESYLCIDGTWPEFVKFFFKLDGSDIFGYVSNKQTHR